MTITSVLSNTFQTGVRSYITTWTATKSEGATATFSGLVVESTNDIGSVLISTSEYPQLNAAEAYQITWTNTNYEGITVTESGIGFVSADSAGHFLTSTSTFAYTNPSDQTKFTTWTTVNPDGITITESGIVLVTRETSGGLFTPTSVIPPSGPVSISSFSTAFASTNAVKLLPNSGENHPSTAEIEAKIFTTVYFTDFEGATIEVTVKPTEITDDPTLSTTFQSITFSSSARFELLEGKAQSDRINYGLHFIFIIIALV